MKEIKCILKKSVGLFAFVSAIFFAGCQDEDDRQNNTNNDSSCVTMIVAIIGLVFSCYQWWKKVQSERAEKLSNLINVLRRDARQLSVLYKIDYNEHWYDKSFHKSKLEGEMDQFLSYYEYILYLKKNHVITKKEFRFLNMILLAL